MLSFDVAVILTVLPFPAFFVITTPLELTEAYFVLLLFHVIPLLVAFEGTIVAISLTDLPEGMVIFEDLYLKCWWKEDSEYNMLFKLCYLWYKLMV